MLALIALTCCNGDESIQDPADTYPYPDGHVTFKYLPMDINQVHFYEPMGTLDIFPSDHGAFIHKEVGSPAATLPIFALTDGQVISIGQSGEDYYMSIKFSTTISTRLGHIGQIADWILDEARGLAKDERKFVFIPVEAGDTIGYVCACSALDLGVHDLSLELNYCYPELAGFESRYAANPLNYYDEPLRSQFADKIFRTVEPKGGKVDYDIKGKLIGNWYLKEKHENFYANHFAIAYDHIFGSRVSFADGYSKFVENNHGGAIQYWVKGNEPNPENIGVGVQVKYEGIFPTRWVKMGGTYQLKDITNVDSESPILSTWLMELTSAEVLKVEMFVGKDKTQVTEFTENARIYVRKPEWRIN